MTMLTFLGLHVLENGPNYMPSLCSENKRRLFSQSFVSDKLGMIFTGRPPLISQRYCSTPLPLDLRDEDLLADPVTLDRAVRALDSRGWNTEGKIYATTIMRARCMIAFIRDEIFEAGLSRSFDVRVDQLL
jgi:hypothetical protein